MITYYHQVLGNPGWKDVSLYLFEIIKYTSGFVGVLGFTRFDTFIYFLIG